MEAFYFFAVHLRNFSTQIKLKSMWKLYFHVGIHSYVTNIQGNDNLCIFCE